MSDCHCCSTEGDVEGNVKPPPFLVSTAVFQSNLTSWFWSVSSSTCSRREALALVARVFSARCPNSSPASSVKAPNETSVVERSLCTVIWSVLLVVLLQICVDNTAVSSVFESHGLAVHARSRPEPQTGEVLGFVSCIAEARITDRERCWRNVSALVTRLMLCMILSTILEAEARLQGAHPRDGTRKRVSLGMWGTEVSQWGSGAVWVVCSLPEAGDLQIILHWCTLRGSKKYLSI